MITIPTTELIGCIADMLPHITDDKGATAGLVIEWTGGALNFAVFDTYSGAEVTWVPGEGAEGTYETGEGEEDIDWGGDDDSWRVFIWLADAKEIVKLFKLPAKLWRFPVKLKVNLSRTKLTVERDDMTRGERLLVVSTYNDVLRHIPSIPQVATMQSETTMRRGIEISAARLGAFGLARPHGPMHISWGQGGEPVRVTVGSRIEGFVYPPGKGGFNMLRDGAGLMTRTSREWPQERSVADPEGS